MAADLASAVLYPEEYAMDFDEGPEMSGFGGPSYGGAGVGAGSSMVVSSGGAASAVASLGAGMWSGVAVMRRMRMRTRARTRLVTKTTWRRRSLMQTSGWVVEWHPGGWLGMRQDGGRSCGTAIAMVFAIIVLQA